MGTNMKRTLALLAYCLPLLASAPAFADGSFTPRVGWQYPIGTGNPGAYVGSFTTTGHGKVYIATAPGSNAPQGARHCEEGTGGRNCPIDVSESVPNSLTVIDNATGQPICAPTPRQGGGWICDGGLRDAGTFTITDTSTFYYDYDTGSATGSAPYGVLAEYCLNGNQYCQ